MTPERSQFTPKMKANAKPRLLSSLVRIDSGVIFGKIHFLLISENEFFPEINVTELRDGITSLHGIHVKLLKKFCAISILSVSPVKDVTCISLLPSASC